VLFCFFHVYVDEKMNGMKFKIQTRKLMISLSDAPGQWTPGGVVEI